MLLLLLDGISAASSSIIFSASSSTGEVSGSSFGTLSGSSAANPFSSPSISGCAGAVSVGGSFLDRPDFHTIPSTIVIANEAEPTTMPAMAPAERRDCWPSRPELELPFVTGAAGESRCIVSLPEGESARVEFESEELALGCGSMTMFSLRNRLQREIGAYCASE
jgi:hypothetical protein